MTKTAETSLAELRHRLLEISDLERAAAVLDWDQATYMPSGGAEARARQGATLEPAGAREIRRSGARPALDALEPHAESLSGDSDAASLIRVARRDFEKAIRVPAEYVARASAAGSRLLRCLDPGKAGERLCRHAALPASRRSISAGEYAGFFAPCAAHRRPADRRHRRRHDGSARSVRSLPICGASWCRWCAP